MKKIIFIEDEVNLKDLLKKKLENNGYEVDTAEDGEEGLNKIRAEKPDLILLDIIMPKKDGFEVMEELQEDEELRSIPVIIVSNSGQPVELERAKRLGVKDWIVKTEFDPQEVVDMVSRQFEEQNRESEGEDHAKELEE
ncbi:MAG: PleD family two-component system response regulator [Candidatus Paceibacterota bacterium]